MIHRFNHTAIATPDIIEASMFYRDVLGAKVSEPRDLPEHGVTIVFVQLANSTTMVELIAPLGDSSPISGFLRRNPSGGIHHVCFEVDDILAASQELTAKGVRLLGDGTPKIGAHGKPVLFLKPRCGHLIELEQA